MRQIAKSVEQLTLPVITGAQRAEGVKSSALGSRQMSEVPMTPLMKNAILHYDGKKPDGWRLKTNDTLTKAEEAFARNISQLLLQFNGSSDEYDENLPLLDRRHYDVQCHQNFKENMRDIQPGQADARRKMAHDYTKPTSNTCEQIIHMLETDIVFQKAVTLVLDGMPAVKASDEIREIDLPFMTKHTGVGYTGKDIIGWRNDRTIDPKSGKSFAEITMSIAESIKDDPKAWDEYNVATMYGRNQRGKGRLLIAVARVLNLILNQLEAVEISTYKDKWNLFVGYKDDVALKEALHDMAHECIANGLKCANEDYSAFDSTVGMGMICLIGALSVIRANGSKSKMLAFKRAVYAQKTILVDGLDNDLLRILGRIFSGFIDTNRGGGLVNAIQMTTCCMKQDPKYSDLIYLLKFYMMVMGDDNLHAYRTLDRATLAKDMKTLFGGVINEKKYEFGPVFLQYRLFEVDNKEVMVYAWTRVVRSMLMKEDAKNLGPAGWTVSFYQQLFKLYEFDEAFAIVVNLLAPFDSEKFYMDKTVTDLVNDVKAEDNVKLASLKTDAQRRRYVSTFDRLYDGDPSKARFAATLKDPENTEGLLYKVWKKIKEVYEPGFYAKYE
nr:MAG: putative RNA-dependent RNA polymerase [Picobirnaviridae sp.]